MPLNISPPLLNSASPWATTLEDLHGIYHNPSTGAVTTRTSLSKGFAHDSNIHQHCFVSENDPSTVVPANDTNDHQGVISSTAERSVSAIASLNTFGYSPYALQQYITWASLLIKASLAECSTSKDATIKPIIISVTGTPDDIHGCYNDICHGLHMIMRAHTEHTGTEDADSLTSAMMMMEINLSCPNIANAPPPAYSFDLLLSYLQAVRQAVQKLEAGWPTIPVGIKLPPYTYQTQFSNLISALLSSTTDGQGCPVAFITATNTLGSSLLLAPSPDREGYLPILSNASGTGIGGLAGASLHPLALGNVATLRRMLDEHDALRHIEIIGVGGVSDGDGYRRMRSVGAAAVGVGTALGVEGVGIFDKISRT